MRASFVLCVMIACGAMTHAMAHVAAPHLAPDGHQPHLTNDELRVRVEQYWQDASAAERDYGPIGEWDTSEVTDMSNLFSHYDGFNADISGWDTSSVTNMSAMFLWCLNFNQDISAWDVSNVLDFSLMFYTARSFNGDVTGWVVDADADFTDMFGKARSFDQCLPWAPEKAIAREMEMFRGSRGSGPKCRELEQCSDLNRRQCNKRDDCFYHEEEKCIVPEPSDLDTCLAVFSAKKCERKMEGCQWLNAGKVCVPLGQRKAECDFYSSKNRCGLNPKCKWDVDHCKKRTGCDDRGRSLRGGECCEC